MLPQSWFDASNGSMPGGMPLLLRSRFLVEPVVPAVLQRQFYLWSSDLVSDWRRTARIYNQDGWTRWIEKVPAGLHCCSDVWSSRSG